MVPSRSRALAREAEKADCSDENGDNQTREDYVSQDFDENSSGEENVNESYRYESDGSTANFDIKQEEEDVADDSAGNVQSSTSTSANNDSNSSPSKNTEKVVECPVCHKNVYQECT